MWMCDCGVDVERTMQFLTATAVSAPTPRCTNVFRRKQHTCRQFCQHAHDAAQTGVSHLAKRSATPSCTSRWGHVVVDWCQGTSAVLLLCVIPVIPI